MDRRTLADMLQPFSNMEKRWQAEYQNTGELHLNDPASVRDPGSGYRVLDNAFMTREGFDDPLHQTLTNPLIGDHLRLIIHQRYQEIPFHSTKFISVDYVYRGNLVVRFPDARPLRLHRGQLCLMNADLVHGYRIERGEDLVMNLQIEKEFLSRDLLFDLQGTGPAADFLIRTMTGQNTDFTFLLAGFEEDVRIENVMEDLFCEYLDPGSLSGVYVRDLMRLFFTMLIRSTASLVRTGTRADILGILNDIERAPEHCSLELLAGRYHFSPKYLGNLIRRQTGETFGTLLEQARMKRATYLLAATDLPIREIASRCGYSNMTFFYRRFRDRYQKSPAQYRSALQGTPAAREDEAH